MQRKQFSRDLFCFLLRHALLAFCFKDLRLLFKERNLLFYGLGDLPDLVFPPANHDRAWRPSNRLIRAVKKSFTRGFFHILKKRDGRKARPR